MLKKKLLLKWIRLYPYIDVLWIHLLAHIHLYLFMQITFPTNTHLVILDTECMVISSRITDVVHYVRTLQFENAKVVDVRATINWKLFFGYAKRRTASRYYYDRGEKYSGFMVSTYPQVDIETSAYTVRVAIRYKAVRRTKWEKRKFNNEYKNTADYGDYKEISYCGVCACTFWSCFRVFSLRRSCKWITMNLCQCYDVTWN